MSATASTEDCATEDATAAIEQVRAFTAAVNRQDWPAVQALLTPTFRRHSVAAGLPAADSPAKLIAYLQAEYASFPDAAEEILDAFSDGTMVGVRLRFSGTQRGPLGPFPPSGRRMTAEYLAFYRLENGRIAESWAEWDNLSGLRQLGHLR